MHVSHLSLVDFRSYPSAEVALSPGVTTFVGPNGQGKTNLIEAVGYLATLDSHRVAGDQALVRLGAERAYVRAALVRDGRTALVEIEITPGRANRAQVNRSPVVRPREILGLLRTVLFAPEDLALVKGDPAERRRFLDELLVARAPRLAGIRADYDRVLRQRNALLKSAGAARRGGGPDLATLDTWDAHLARVGAELIEARLEAVDALRPRVDASYDALSQGGGPVGMAYRSSLGPDAVLTSDRGRLVDALLGGLAARRDEELARGLTLVGPHRDELMLSIGDLPARGYASHGESWSLALALRLGGYGVLTEEGAEPVLLLDDVFAELDADRRARLAELVAPAEQVLVTAAVAADVPSSLSGVRYDVGAGVVQRAA